MVGVECDRGIILRGDSHRDRLAVRVLQIDLLTDRKVLRAGKLRDLHGDDRVRIRLAVRLVRHQVHLDGLPDFHIRHGSVESGDHHARAADKLQRFAAVVG